MVNHSAVMKTANQLKMRRKRRHIPHAERPLEAVQKRNERERQRVHEVNAAFLNLLNHLPQHQTMSYQLTMHQMTATRTASSSKMSKINILRQAIAYIDNLSNILQSTTSTETIPAPAMPKLFHHCDSTLDEINLLIKNHQDINRTAFSSQANVSELTELHNTMANCYSHWNSCVMTENTGFPQEKKFWNPPIEFLPNTTSNRACSRHSF